MTVSPYRELGLRPAVNALGIYTDVGGSRLSPKVWARMEAANRHFVAFPELLDRTGEVVAARLGTEAARVTPGASAGIAMATAACMAGTEGRLIERLPDTDGMRSTILIQRRHRYKYDRMVRMAGARIAELGNVNGTDVDDLVEAVDERTAAVFFPAHLEEVQGTVGLEKAAEIAHAHGLPVIVDAAYLNYPVERMGSYCRRGADLAIFSAKYFGGPNAGGFVCGRADLIRAVAAVDFTRFEAGKHLQFGRPFKLDRQIVIGVVAALEEWLDMDHALRFASYFRLVSVIAEQLKDLDRVTTRPMSFTMDEQLVDEPVNCLTIRSADDAASGVVGRLAAGDPSILVHAVDGLIVVDVECMDEDEAALVGRRLREELLASVSG